MHVGVWVCECACACKGFNQCLGISSRWTFLTTRVCKVTRIITSTLFSSKPHNCKMSSVIPQSPFEMMPFSTDKARLPDAVFFAIPRSQRCWTWGMLFLSSCWAQPGAALHYSRKQSGLKPAQGKMIRSNAQSPAVEPINFVWVRTHFAHSPTWKPGRLSKLLLRSSSEIAKVPEEREREQIMLIAFIERKRNVSAKLNNVLVRLQESNSTCKYI